MGPAAQMYRAAGVAPLKPAFGLNGDFDFYAIKRTLAPPWKSGPSGPCQARGFEPDLQSQSSSREISLPATLGFFIGREVRLDP
jgi:hypothetical protein